MQAPSSTSSSDSPRFTLAHAAWALAGIICTIACFEGAVAARFSIPKSAREPSGALQKYFSYGYSIESKLSRSVGQPGEEPTPIVRAGWIPTELYQPTDQWETATRRVSVYGMSFTNRIANALSELQPDYAISKRAGPGAPISHSYAMFKQDPWNEQADTIVIGVLSSSLPYTQTMSGISYAFESPSPFTFPKYEHIDGRLITTQPVIQSRDEFVEAFRTGSDQWSSFTSQLRTHDAYFDPFVFEQGILDRSATIRLIRRAWASRQSSSCSAQVYNPQTGYRTDNPSIAAVPHILQDMQRSCSENNQQLIVILLHAKGEPGHLDRWLTKDLESQGISVISTTQLLDATDPMNFLPDGHYTRELDTRIAEKLRDLIASHPNARPRPTPPTTADPEVTGRNETP